MLKDKIAAMNSLLRLSWDEHQARVDEDGALIDQLELENEELRSLL